MLQQAVQGPHVLPDRPFPPAASPLTCGRHPSSPIYSPHLSTPHILFIFRPNKQGFGPVGTSRLSSSTKLPFFFGCVKGRPQRSIPFLFNLHPWR
ncbi:hypothetical protein MUK42_34502 [Musa troglodytarum]|uniref:Uncharacterized protein n=1 Tax=Musa troglodytarum TaxID=320322 RepID=A0A9E7K3T2_9LILI|nr:hypothetical protein MUK42_34502 [Musa troglodytarum]